MHWPGQQPLTTRDSIVLALMIIFAHDWVYRFHSKWFSIPTEAFDTIHYAGIACYKIVMFLFNLAPYLALLIVL